MSKLLIISHDHIGERMAGAEIRYFEIACALAASHDVILAAPLGSHLPQGLSTLQLLVLVEV